MRERYQVPIGMEIATQWAWRILVIASAVLLGVFFLRYFSEITVPIAVAVLVTALTVNARRLARGPSGPAPRSDVHRRRHACSSRSSAC